MYTAQTGVVHPCHKTTFAQNRSACVTLCCHRCVSFAQDRLERDVRSKWGKCESQNAQAPTFRPPQCSCVTT